MTEHRGIHAWVINQEHFDVNEWTNEIANWGKSERKVAAFVGTLNEESKAEMLEKTINQKSWGIKDEKRLQHLVDLLSLSNGAVINLLEAINRVNCRR